MVVWILLATLEGWLTFAVFAVFVLILPWGVLGGVEEAGFISNTAYAKQASLHWSVARRSNFSAILLLLSLKVASDT
jgi:hypothetical protein